MFTKVLLVTLISTVAFAYGGDVFSGYKVYRMTPENEAQVQVLRALEELGGVSFWTGPNPPHRSSDVMIPPHLQGDIVEGIKKHGIAVNEYISNVQTLIDNEGPLDTKIVKGTRYDFQSYLDVDEVYAWLDEQAALHPDIATVVSIGKSFEGRDLKVLKISKSGETKPAIWLDANIHAREWITGAVSLYVIDQLLNSDNAEIKSWTDDYDWYVLPVHNPDGLAYSKLAGNRMWRKTRSDTDSILNCKGADANRNWGFEWFTGGSSSNPCSDTYAGPSAFSEPEAKLTSEFLESISDRLAFFLSLHSYSQLILIPYGVDIEFPQHEVYMDIGLDTKDAIAQKYRTEFTPGNIVDLLYVASGGSMDWAKGVLNVPLTFTFELRDTGAYGFILPPSLIIPSSEEFMDGLAVMINALRAGIPESDAARKQTKPAIIKPQILHKNKPTVDFRGKFFSKH